MLGEPVFARRVLSYPLTCTQALEAQVSGSINFACLGSEATHQSQLERYYHEVCRMLGVFFVAGASSCFVCPDAICWFSCELHCNGKVRVGGVAGWPRIRGACLIVDITGPIVRVSCGPHNGAVFLGSQIHVTLVCNVICCSRSLQLASKYIVELTLRRTNHRQSDRSRSVFEIYETPRTTQGVPDLTKFALELFWKLWRILAEI